MGSSQAEKRQTHVKLVDVAAQRLREGGLARLSIADLMAEAGLSHGGFYKHFASRDVLVTEAVEAALANGASLVEPGSTKRSFEDLMRSYPGVAHRDDRGVGCAVPALLTEAEHAPAAARAPYTRQVEDNLATLQAMLAREGRDGSLKSFVALAAMVGALGLARAVSDQGLSDRILDEVGTSLIMPGRGSTTSPDRRGRRASATPVDPTQFHRNLA